jgi:hypothetical protein
MSSDTTLELYKRYATEQDKYVYFLLPAAGAGIGFVVQRTDGALLTLPQCAAGLAVLFWGLSFWSGCRHIRARLLTVYNNMTLNQLYDGNHPMQPPPELFEAIVANTNASFDKATRRAARSGRWQFAFLVAGAIALVVWRFWDMFDRTFPGAG